MVFVVLFYCGFLIIYSFIRVLLVRVFWEGFGVEFFRMGNFYGGDRMVSVFR